MLIGKLRARLESKLVIYNDDVNTFDHVIDCLVKYCDHEMLQAEQCALIIHHNGKCSVKEGPYDRLEPVAVALMNKGLSATIE
jgi:ATP-dependent Clp protease adaptor protein ClpS